MIQIVTKDFETFDSKKYKNRKPQSETVLRAFLPDGTYIEMDSFLFWKMETPPNSYFMVSKSYYSNGNIKQKGLYFNVPWFFLTKILVRI